MIKSKYLMMPISNPMPTMKNAFLALALVFSSSLYAQIAKPQDPQPPFNYNIEEVSFPSKADGIKLSGTLTYPKEGKVFASIILISGSGAQDRDSELLGHRPFWVIADHFSKNGYAVLRVDDRGAGESEGDYNTATLDDFLGDTHGALDYMLTRKEVDPKLIGLVGHSLGGVIAPMISVERPEVAFMILLAGSGIPGDELMLLQKEKIERRMGVPDEGIAAGQKNIGGAYDLITSGEGSDDSLKVKLTTYFNDVFGEALPAEQVDAVATQLSYPWLVDFIRHDPSVPLSKVQVPVLALIGSKDTQVPSLENLTAIEMALNEAGNTQYETAEVADLNHLFQECITGLPIEYGGIEQTFSPRILEVMGLWMRKTTIKLSVQ